MKTIISVHLEWDRGSEQGGIEAFQAAITKGLEKFIPNALKPIDFNLDFQENSGLDDVSSAIHQLRAQLAKVVKHLHEWESLVVGSASQGEICILCGDRR